MNQKNIFAFTPADAGSYPPYVSLNDSDGELVLTMRGYSGGGSVASTNKLVISADDLRKIADGINAYLATTQPPQAQQVAEAVPNRPSDDKLWDQTLRERDRYHDVADRLAGAIAEYFGADIGEHSSANCPWDEAERVIEEAAPYQPTAQAAPASQVPDGKACHAILRGMAAHADEWAGGLDHEPSEYEISEVCLQYIANALAHKPASGEA